ncbi:MAG: thioredoxin family protein [Bacteroidetes bacterium]|nr:thioredoxin family protein [Bacteroidota bacterium]
MEKYLKKSYTYKEYISLLENLMLQGKTTGETQTDELINYANLNLARIHRLEKTVEITPELKELILNIKHNYTWLVITEGWCGDAAQNITPLYFITQLNPKINLALVLRDDNLDLMDKYLTNGGRSIPKLICLDENNKEIFNWGPRPIAAQKIVQELMANKATLEEKSLTIQKWYNTDKTLSLQNEFVELIKKHMI